MLAITTLYLPHDTAGLFIVYLAPILGSCTATGGGGRRALVV
jgi:hypothetical protein